MSGFRQIFRTELQTQQILQNHVFVIDFGTYSIKAGFSHNGQPLLELINFFGKNKTKDNQTKFGQDISENEILKQSVVSPYTENVIVQIINMQTILEYVFEKCIQTDSDTFPCHLVMTLPYGTPVISLEYVEDLLINCFNVDKLKLKIINSELRYNKQLQYQNKDVIVVHFGYQFTTLLSQTKQRRIPIGQKHIIDFLYKSLTTHYGDVIKNINIDQLMLFYQQNALFLQNQSNDNTQQENYYQLQNDFNTYLQKYQRPENSYPQESIEYLQQNAFNIYQYVKQYKLDELTYKLNFIGTNISYKSQFNQNILIQMREKVEKFQQQNVFKLLKLINLTQQEIDQHFNGILQTDIQGQLITILKVTHTKLKQEQIKLEKLYDNISGLVDQVVSMQFSHSEQVLDMQKLQSFQREVVDNLAFTFECCIYLLKKDHCMLYQKFHDLNINIFQLSYLPLLHSLEGSLCDENGEIQIPVFNEHIIANELLFNLQQIGLQTQSLDEILIDLIRTSKEHEKPISVVICGGGSQITNISHRISEITGKFKNIEIINRGGVKIEWEDLITEIQQ